MATSGSCHCSHCRSIAGVCVLWGLYSRVPHLQLKCFSKQPQHVNCRQSRCKLCIYSAYTVRNWQNRMVSQKAVAAGPKGTRPLCLKWSFNLEVVRVCSICVVMGMPW